MDSGSRWYNVRIVCKLRPELSWRVARRYREFDALVSSMNKENEPALPPLPPKMPSILMGVAERQRRVLGLQTFCQAALANPALVAHKRISEFFDLDFGCARETHSKPPHTSPPHAFYLYAFRLWHMSKSDREAQPLLLDNHIHWAASHIQCYARRMRVRRRIAQAVRAVSTLRGVARRIASSRPFFNFAGEEPPSPPSSPVRHSKAHGGTRLGSVTAVHELADCLRDGGLSSFVRAWLSA